MKKYIILLFLAPFFTGVYAQSTPETIPNVLQKFEKSLVNQDVTVITPLLAENFSIGIYQYPMTNSMLESILKNHSKLISLKLLKTKVEGTKTTITIKYSFEDKSSSKSSIILNEQHKISYVDLFDKLYRLDRYKKSKKVSSFPFEVINESIAIKIKLNNVDDELTMLFDTGADGMAISEEVANRIGLTELENHEASVVGANAQVKISRGNSIHIESLKIPDQQVVIFPKMSGGFDGLFGGNLIRKYITHVNFDKKVIELYNFGEFQENQKAMAIPIDYSSGIPVLETKIDFKNKEEISGKVVFDTGASYNLILFGPYVEKEDLRRGFQPDFFSQNFSFGHQTRIMSGDLQSLQIGDSKFNHVNVSLQKYEEGSEKWASEDGSLGINVISKFNFTVNLVDKVIYLEPNKSFNTPFDFVLRGLFLTFDNEKRLIVKDIIKGTKADAEGIKIGDQVLSINNIKGNTFYTSENQSELRKDGISEFVFKISQKNKEIEVSL